MLISFGAAKAEVLAKTKTIGGTRVEYKVVLPKNFDAAKTYPGILATMLILPELLSLSAIEAKLDGTS